MTRRQSGSRCLPPQCSQLVIVLTERTLSCTQRLALQSLGTLPEAIRSRIAHRQRSFVRFSCSSRMHSPAVSPLAASVRLDRIPLVSTVCGPRLRSTGFKRPAGQGEKCASCFIRRTD